MPQFLAFLTALPALIETLGRIAELMNRIIVWQEKNNIKGWTDDLEKTIDRLEAAKTSDDKFAAAAALAASLRKL